MHSVIWSFLLLVFISRPSVVTAAINDDCRISAEFYHRATNSTINVPQRLCSSIFHLTNESIRSDPNYVDGLVCPYEIIPKYADMVNERLNTNFTHLYEVCKRNERCFWSKCTDYIHLAIMLFIFLLVFVVSVSLWLISVCLYLYYNYEQVRMGIRNRFAAVNLVHPLPDAEIHHLQAYPVGNEQPPPRASSQMSLHFTLSTSSAHLPPNGPLNKSMDF